MPASLFRPRTQYSWECCLNNVFHRCEQTEITRVYYLSRNENYDNFATTFLTFIPNLSSTFYTYIFLLCFRWVETPSLVSSLPPHRKRKRERENVSKFHLYLCDDAKKHEKRERYPFTVKNREGETNQKPLIRFINRNMECTRWGEGKRNIGVKRGMREGEKVIDRHLGRISRWRWFTGGEEIREKWKELK